MSRKIKGLQHFPKTAKRLLPIVLCLGLLLSACTAQPAKEDNLFSYAIDSSNDLFAPKSVSFQMTVDEVLKATGLSEDTVDTEESYPRIIHDISIPGLSDEIREVFHFDKLNSDEDKLVSVEYFFSVSEEEFETVCQTLADQAETVMPPELLMEGESHIQDGQGASWEDGEKNYVFLRFMDSAEIGVHVVILQLTMTRGDRKTLID